MSSSAHDYALRLLAARAYTERALFQKLERRFERPECHAVIRRLVASGLVDDARYAAEFARQRLAAGSSVRRVRQDLGRKGVARELIEAAITRVLEEEPVDVSASLTRSARKKLASLGDLDVHVKRRRAFAHLARRGFEIDDINRTLGELLREESEA